MKEISALNLPDHLRYAEDHEWADMEGEKVRIGVSDYAQDQLGDIVFVELPRPGDVFTKGQQFGVVESVKAVAELYTPVGGEVLAVNKTLEDSPEILNKSPYEDGWMVELKPSDPSEIGTLMTKNAYLEMLKGKQ
ncbi:MAG: glycine cleavage system protein GcvH [Proteobacteria bacterium]|nr:glycine cleavage system protein GcvH [Pseudomonadota bacterium]